MPSSALPTVSCDGGGWQGGVLKGWAWTRLYFLWGIACFSSMDIAGSGRRNKQTFPFSSGMGLFTEAVL